MSQHSPSYDLQSLIQRLKLVQNQEVIRQFHGLLDLLDQSTTTPDLSQKKEFLLARVQQAEEDIKYGRTIPHDELKDRVKKWIEEKKG